MEYINVEIEDHVATVTFDRPPVNALNAQAFREIEQAFTELRHGTDAHVAIFTAAGGPGGDPPDRACARRAHIPPSRSIGSAPVSVMPPLQGACGSCDAFWRSAWMKSSMRSSFAFGTVSW